jgi:hypothetical protein
MIAMNDFDICIECQFRRSYGCGRGKCVYEDFVDERRKIVKNVFTREWFAATAVRMVRTFGEAALAYIGTGAVVLNDVNWLGVLSAGCMGAAMSFLLALSGLPEVEDKRE